MPSHDPEVSRRSSRRFRRTHRARINSETAAYRAQRKGARLMEIVDQHTIWERDGGLCAFCHRPCPEPGDATVPYRERFSFDHIVPCEYGGDHSYTNVRTAHIGCNSTRSYGALELPPMTPEEEAWVYDDARPTLEEIEDVPF